MTVIPLIVGCKSETSSKGTFLPLCSRKLNCTRKECPVHNKISSSHMSMHPTRDESHAPCTVKANSGTETRQRSLRREQKEANEMGMSQASAIQL